jgi:MFS family permease
VFRNPDLRRLELAFLGSAIGGLYANGVVLSVYAYHHGGATAVGLVMFARMGVATLAAPFTSTLADRHPQQRVMLAADLTRVVTVAAAAAAAAAGASAAVYVLAVVTSVVSTSFRPAEASLMPLLARSPEELTAANVATSTFDSVGSFAGPALGALALALGGPAAGFAVIAAAYAWSALFVVRISAPERPPASAAGDEATGAAAGWRVVRAEPRLRLLLGLYGAQALIAGANLVLVVLIALQVLALGNSGLGLLQAAIGIGSVAGAAAALALIARRRVAGDFALGLVLYGAPLLLIAAFPHAWAAVPALIVLGVGNSIVDVSVVTLIQRTAPPAVAGRIFGVVEATLVAAIGLGSLATPLLVHLLGVRTALVVAGTVLPTLVVLTRRPLGAADAGATVPEEQLGAIAVVPFLDALPLQRKEALAAALQRVELPAGATLFSRGDPGNRLYILTDGELEIDLPEGAKVERAPAFVGEIALLRGVPRTATVRAVTLATLWALDGEQFVPLVTGHSRSSSSADDVIASRGVAFGI